MPPIGPNAQMIPIPAARGLGLFTNQGVTPAGEASRQRVTSPLAEMLPTMAEPLAAGTIQIPVPIGLNTAAVAAWFPLIDIPVDTAFGQDVLLFSADIDQCSPDVEGDAINDILAWGDSSGNGAYIVVGTNFPTTGKTDWVAAPCNLPGVNATGTPTLLQSDRAQYILNRSFPSGSSNNTTPVRRTIPKSWAPFCYRFPLGSRIQAALVLQGSIVHALGVSKLIRCSTMTQLWVGLTRNTTGLART